MTEIARAKVDAYMNARERDALETFRNAVRITVGLKHERAAAMVDTMAERLGTALEEQAWLKGFSVVMESEPATDSTPPALGPKLVIKEFDFGNRVVGGGTITAHFRPTYAQAACYFAAELARAEADNLALRTWWGFRLAAWTSHLGRRALSMMKRLVLPPQRHERVTEEDD